MHWLFFLSFFPSRNGLYSKKLLTNFSLLLRHLCRTRRLFTKRHPLDEIARSDGKKLAKNLQQQETIYSATLFHEEMIEHCSRHDFMNLLYFYLDFYRSKSTLFCCLCLIFVAFG